MAKTLRSATKRDTTLIINEEVGYQSPYILYRCKVKRENNAVGHAGEVSMHEVELLQNRYPEIWRTEVLFCLQRAIMAEMGESILPI